MTNPYQGSLVRVERLTEQQARTAVVPDGRRRPAVARPPRRATLRVLAHCGEHTAPVPVELVGSVVPTCRRCRRDHTPRTDVQNYSATLLPPPRPYHRRPEPPAPPPPPPPHIARLPAAQQAILADAKALLRRLGVA